MAKYELGTTVQMASETWVVCGIDEGKRMMLGEYLLPGRDKYVWFTVAELDARAGA